MIKQKSNLENLQLMSLSELKELQKTINNLIQLKEPTLRVGMKCEVNSPQVFGLLGEIIKVNRTRCKVKFEGSATTWNVPKKMIILK